jgi:tetratricopeptide (TPR) repeat protein
MQLRYILICLLTIFLNSCENESEGHYKNANVLYNQKHYKESLTEIEKAEKLDDSNLEFNFLKAKIYAKLDLYEESNFLLLKLVEKKFKLDTSYYLISNNFFQIGKNINQVSGDEAKVDLTRQKTIFYLDLAINFNRYYYDCYILKYKTLYNLSKSKDALLLLNHSLNIFKDSVQLIMYRGISKSQVGDFNGSLIDLNSAIFTKKMDSSDRSIAYRFKGKVFRNLNKYDSSISNYNIAISYDPLNSYLYFERGELYILKNNLIDSACPDFRKSADLGLIKAYEFINKNCQ